jgi:hypothetical protein
MAIGKLRPYQAKRDFTKNRGAERKGASGRPNIPDLSWRSLALSRLSQNETQKRNPEIEQPMR